MMSSLFVVVSRSSYRFLNTFVLGCFGCVVLAGCDGQSSVQITDVESQLAKHPIDHSVAFRMAAALSDSTQSGRLINGNFSEGNSGWGTCSGNDVIVVNGEANVAAGDCIQQGVEVTTGESLELQCEASAVPGARGASWSGMNISFYTSDWAFISEPFYPALVGENASYGVVGEVPPNAAYAGVWVYTETGATVSNCVLADSGTLPEIPHTGPLLVNGNFDDAVDGKLIGWTDQCGGTVNYNKSGFAGNINLSDGACLTQSLSAGAISRLRGQAFTFWCTIWFSGGDTYGEISTNLTGEHTTTPLASYYSGSAAVRGIVGDDLDNAYVSIYSEGQPGRKIDDCYLTPYSVDNLPEPAGPQVADDLFEFNLSDQPISIVNLRVFDNDEGSINFRSILITQQPSVGTVTVDKTNPGGVVVSYESSVRADDSFRYRLADSSNTYSDEATVNIRYTAGGDNIAPIARNDDFIIPSLSRTRLDIRQNDFDPDGIVFPVTEILETSEDTSVSISGDGDYVNYNSYNSGWFRYRITDADGVSADATATVVTADRYSKQMLIRQPANGIVVDGVISPGEYDHAGAGIFPTSPIEGERVSGIVNGVRVAYDEVSLYIATSFEKDSIMQDSHPVDGQIWHDDSFEIYLDLENEGNEGYDPNDVLRIFGVRDESPVTFNRDESQLNLSQRAKCTEPRDGYHVCEVAFFLSELSLSERDEFGFDIQWNIDVDGGERDAKYSWCDGTGNRTTSLIDAWQDISQVNCSVVLGQ